LANGFLTKGKRHTNIHRPISSSISLF
jgi:hypothetical protein